MKFCFRLNLENTAILLLLATLLCSSKLQAALLPAVTGVTFDGERITWNPVPDAIGYNIQFNSFYLDTVVGITSYSPEQRGTYRILAFDNEGNFSPANAGPGDVSPTTNSVFLATSVLNVSAPANVNGMVYSTTVGEIFWNKVFTRSLEYQIFLNGQLQGTTFGNSFLLDGLTPFVTNSIFLRAKTLGNQFSDIIKIDINTQAGAFPRATAAGELSTQPLPPQNARITRYSDTAAELFWDRPSTFENIVNSEVFRDGVFIGSNVGPSFYDDTRTAGVNHSYRVIAINANGEPSDPTFVNPGPFDGQLSQITQRLLTSITEVTTNDPHQIWFPTLRSFTEGFGLETLDLTSSIPTEEDGVLQSVRSEYICDDQFGTLTIDSAPSALSTTTLTFDFCSIDQIFVDGIFTLVNTDAGGYTATYENLFIDTDLPVSMDGEVNLSVGRAFNDRILTYTDFDYGFDGSLVDDDVLDFSAVLNQQIADTVVDLPRHHFRSDFSIIGALTNGRELIVSTTRRFEDIDQGSGNYMIGELIIRSTNGEELVVSADTGDASTWSATASNASGTEAFTGTWGETLTLPCLSAFPEDEELTGCEFR